MNVHANAAVGYAYRNARIRSFGMAAGDVTQTDVEAGVISGKYDYLVPIVAIGIIVLAASGEK
jgi:hypothetical protein